MDDDVGGEEEAEVVASQAKPVGADVAGDRPDAAGAHLVELGLAKFVSEQVERVVLENVAGDTRLCTPSARPDEQDQLAVGDRAHEPFDEGGSEKAGGPGDGYPLSRKLFCDHAVCSTSISPISTNW